MPLDSTGNYRHNDQSARMHSKPEEKVLSPKSEEEEPGEDESVHEHLKSMHEKTGEAHSHIAHHADGSHTSNHIDEDGEVSGPHDHENMEALKEHMDQFLNEEADEKGDEEPDEQPEHEGHVSALGV